MSERERLLPTVDPAAPRAGSSGDPAGTSVPIASSDNLASLDARRRATTRKFVAQTVSLLGACAVILSCHTQLASVQFGSRDLPSAESAAGADVAGRLDPAAQGLLASEVVAAAGVALGTFGRGTRLPRRADSPSAPKDGPRACSRR